MSTTSAPKRVQSDFQEVEHAIHFPSACLMCTTSKGPFVDTLRENAIGRVYVCRSCVTLAARVLGLIKGERHLELQNAADLLSAKQKELADRDQAIQQHLQELSTRRDRINALDTLLEQERSTVATQKHALDLVVETADAARRNPT